MTRKNRNKNNIWYQVESRNTNYLNIKEISGTEIMNLLEAIKEKSELTSPADSLILRVKKKTDVGYIILNDEYYHSNCNGSFNTLINDFDISQTNPILVTPPEDQDQKLKELEDKLAALLMQSPQGSTSSVIPVITGTSTAEIQAQSNEIWIHYDEQDYYFKQELGLSNVEELIDYLIIIFKLKKVIVEKVFNLRRRGESKNLNLETSISELYNTQHDALEFVVVDKMPKTVMHEFKYASYAFDHEFKNKLDFVGHFRKYIDSCHHKSKDTYMPYLSIIQSSGYGKSRLVKQYANNVYTLYLNLGIGRNCFPRPSANAKDFISSFEKSKDSITWFNFFLAKAISLIKENQENYSNPSQFWAYQLSDDGKSIWEPAINAANMYELSMHKTGELKQLESIMNNASYLMESFENLDSDVKVLLCIDEGRTLLQYENNDLHMSLFRCWRRALRNNKWRACGLFSVILDTTSRLSNFAPSLKDDPTLKALNDSRKIFMPFIDITTFNSLTEASDDYYNCLFSNGRPCWKALKDAHCGDIISGANDFHAWNKVKDIIKVKIQGGGNFLAEETNMDKNHEERKTLTSVAILASLCSVDISPSVQFASNLIGSHLGTCLAISQDRMKILVCYPSEPLITEAVYELLNNDILHCIAQTFSQGIVEPGKCGELVGELILILTRQNLQTRRRRKKETSFFAGEIKLMDFLNDLLLDSKIILNDNSNEHNTLKNANISFTRFVTISTIPTKDDLINGYRNGVAFNLKRNQKGADFLIPVCSENNEYMLWIIQIKNHNIKLTDANSQVDSTSKLLPKYVFKNSDLENFNSPYLAMYWQLGAHDRGIENKEWGVSGSLRSGMRNPTTHYIILSIKSFRVARGRTLESLRAILGAYVNPYDEMWSYDSILGDRIKYIETFLPWCPSKPNKELLLDKYIDTDAQNIEEDN